jgi:hypothetical protein
LPFSVEVEQSLLGALLLDSSVFDKVVDLVSEADFHIDGHRRIWRAIASMLRHGQFGADIVTVAELLEREDAARFAELGGIAYLGTLVQSVPSALNAPRYAELVRQKAVARRLDAFGQDLCRLARSPDGRTVEALVAEFHARGKIFVDAVEPLLVRRDPAIDWRARAAQDPPPRRWAIKPWFGFGHITLLPGDAGIGKTLLAEQIGSCLSIGRPFIGEISEPHQVLLWACEDDGDELHRRQISIAKWLDVPLEAFAERLHVVPRVGLENTLVSSQYGQVMPTSLLGRLSEQVLDLGVRVVLLDNVAQLFGVNENVRHEVTAAMNLVLGALPGCAILLLAHPARALGSEFSGSSAWEASARTRLFLGSKLPDQKVDPEDTPEDDVRYLSRRKANYSSRDWRRFTFQDGVLKPDPSAQETGGGMLTVLRKQSAERIVIEGLRRLVSMGLDATNSRGTERYLPAMLSGYKLAGDFSRAELADAMRRLMMDGKLRRVAVGKYGNRAPRFGLQENAS